VLLAHWFTHMCVEAIFGQFIANITPHTGRMKEVFVRFNPVTLNIQTTATAFLSRSLATLWTAGLIVPCEKFGLDFAATVAAS